MVSGESWESEGRTRRFSNFRIAEHLALIVLFFSLAVTGLCQKFHYLGVSQFVIGALGGIDSARSLHHMAGVLFTALLLQHAVASFLGVLMFRWKPSMLIALRDAQDAVADVRYYLGIEERPAPQGRFSYKEKFIYWLTFLGGLQMIATGLTLWFPVDAARYMPGQFIAAAKDMHSSDAMLLFLIVVVWHIYDSVLNPEVFPLDKSIFTGFQDPRAEGRGEPLTPPAVKKEGAKPVDGMDAL